MQLRDCGAMLGVVMALSLTTCMSAEAQAPASGSADRSAHPPAKASAAAPTKMALEPRALDLIKAASDKLAAAGSMTFTAVASYEYPSQLGPPILYTVRYDVIMQRPDKLRVIIPGDGPRSEFYYNGKTMTAYAPVENLAAVADAPPTIGAALEAAFMKADIYYPFSDLLLPDPAASLTEGAILTFYVGPSDIVGSVKTEMVVLVNKDIFLQFWIGIDDKLPRRIRAIYSADPLGLRHQLDLSDWQIDPQIAPGTFNADKAQSAQPMAFDRPAHVPGPLPPTPKPKTGSKP